MNHDEVEASDSRKDWRRKGMFLNHVSLAQNSIRCSSFENFLFE